MPDPYGPDPFIGIAIALPVLAIVAVSLRFYVRLRMRHTYLGTDDWLVLFSVVLVCGQGAIQVLGVTIGVEGRDAKHASHARNSNQQKLNHSLVILEKVTYTAIKLSVLFLYRRIFSANPVFKRLNDALILLIILWGLLFFFLENFFCGGDEHSSVNCTKQEWTLLWFAITEIIGDIAILSLPFPCVRRLQMERRDKIGLMGIFALGTLSTIIGLVRLAYVAKNFHAFFHPTYVNKTGGAPTFWTTVEVSTGVIASCLPPLRPLLRKIPGPRKLYGSLRRSLQFKRELYGMERLEGPDSGVQDERFTGRYQDGEIEMGIRG